MGFLNRVFGRKESDADSQRSAAPPLDAGVPGTSGSEHSVNIPSIPSADVLPSNVNKILKTPEDVDRMYSPYSGMQSIDAATPKVFRMPKQPEFVFTEEATVRRRGTGENIGFYTGVGYLSGAIGGGTLGAVQGFTQRDGIPMHSRRLLLNRLLNSSGQTGRLAGNTLGCLGLLFACSESLGGQLLDAYYPYSPVWLSTVLAGAMAGGVFRSPRGPKAAAITSAIGALGGASLVAMRNLFPGL